MIEFNRIRNVLNERDISYKYYVRDTKVGWLDFLLFLPSRAITSSLESEQYSKVYYLFVSNKYKDMITDILGM